MSELLSKHGFNFQKKYGQNFLQDVKIPRRIAAECTDYTLPEEPGAKIPSVILEIGPGAGILTGELADRFEKVVAVEIDTALKPVLAESLAGRDNVRIVFGDIMETELAQLLEPHRFRADGSRLPVSVCANLPYYITTPILMKLVEEYHDFEHITVMVQKEVAARLTARPGSADYGSITAALGLYGSVKRLFTVPAGCFLPRPKVDSAVVRLSLHRPAKYTLTQIAETSAIIKAAFSMRRKTLINALAPRTGLDKTTLAALIADTLGEKETVRGESLNSEQFVKLAEAISEMRDRSPTETNFG